MKSEEHNYRQRRFGGLERLYGEGVLNGLQNSHIMVAGLGGVGTWCAEALARSGVGELTLIDLDHIAESNVNRQLHALSSTLGQSKVQAMHSRIQQINANCQVNLIDDFITPENVAGIFTVQPTIVIDCTDQVAAKIAMILEGRRLGIPLLLCGGAGGKTDPLKLRGGDLSLATHDALLSRIRSNLRSKHGFPKLSGKPNSKKKPPKMGVWALWLEQETILPQQWRQADTTDSLQGLSCAGYGSAVTVTAAMGMAAASKALNFLVQKFSQSSARM